MHGSRGWMRCCPIAPRANSSTATAGPARRRRRGARSPAPHARTPAADPRPGGPHPPRPLRPAHHRTGRVLRPLRSAERPPDGDGRRALRRRQPARDQRRVHAPGLPGPRAGAPPDAQADPAPAAAWRDAGAARHERQRKRTPAVPRHGLRRLPRIGGARDLAASMMKRVLTAAAAALMLAAFSPAGHAFMEGFIDQEDGHLDMSDWMVNRKGFLPVPIVITEPAVGYGGGLALMFVRNSIRESAEKAKETGHMTPPDVLGVGAAATENGTHAA